MPLVLHALVSLSHGFCINCLLGSAFMVHAGEAEDFMQTPLNDLAQQIAAGKLHVQVGKVFKLEDIVEAHRCMDDNTAGGKIVVLT